MRKSWRRQQETTPQSFARMHGHHKEEMESGDPWSPTSWKNMALKNVGGWIIAFDRIFTAVLMQLGPFLFGTDWKKKVELNFSYYLWEKTL